MKPIELKTAKDVKELHRHEIYSGVLTRRYSEDLESTFLKLDDGKTRYAHLRSYMVSDENSWPKVAEKTDNAVNTDGIEKK